MFYYHGLKLMNYPVPVNDELKKRREILNFTQILILSVGDKGNTPLSNFIPSATSSSFIECQHPKTINRKKQFTQGREHRNFLFNVIIRVHSTLCKYNKIFIHHEKYIVYVKTIFTDYEQSNTIYMLITFVSESTNQLTF